MINLGILSLILLGYFALLFAAASWAEHKGKKQQSIIANPTVYTLSMAVFCTSWTFYGSVGRAATSGLDFLAVYLGPTLMAFTWWFFLRKMLRVSKELKLVSIADYFQPIRQFSNPGGGGHNLCCRRNHALYGLTN